MAFPSRFLIDECLSPKLADFSNDITTITHVNFRGLTGLSDHRIAQWCVDHDHALVTNNGRDFLAIYRRLSLHPGLIIILPSVDAGREAELLASALAAIARTPDLLNRLVEVDGEGRVRISDLSRSGSS